MFVNPLDDLGNITKAKSMTSGVGRHRQVWCKLESSLCNVKAKLHNPLSHTYCRAYIYIYRGGGGEREREREGEKEGERDRESNGVITLRRMLDIFNDRARNTCNKLRFVRCYSEFHVLGRSSDNYIYIYIQQFSILTL